MDPQSALLGDQGIPGPQQRSLQAREGKITSRTIQKRAREAETLGVTRGGFCFDGRSAGLRQGKKLCRLVECFTRGVINGSAQPVKAVYPFDHQELAMTPRDEKQEVRIGQRLCQSRGEGMPGKVVNPNDRFARSGGDAFGKHDTRQDTADQPRTRGDGDPVHLCQGHASRRKGLLHATVEPFRVRTRGNFGHDAPEGRMKLCLTFDHRGQDHGIGVILLPHDGGGGIIATRFDSKKGQRCHIHCPQGCSRGNTAGMAPQHQALSILLTRPAAQSERFAADLVARFGSRVRVMISPVMELRFLDPDLPEGGYRTLILTSETGVEAARRLRSAGINLPERAICVGERTASVAGAAGFQASSAKGDAEALINLVMSRPDEGPYLHLRGREARGDIAPRLMAMGRKADALIVYEQVAVALDAEVREMLAGTRPVIVPVFSPRSAVLLAEQGPFAAPLHVVAISAAAASAADRLAPMRLDVAERPDSAAMMDAVARIISEATS